MSMNYIFIAFQMIKAGAWEIPLSAVIRGGENELAIVEIERHCADDIFMNAKVTLINADISGNVSKQENEYKLFNRKGSFGIVLHESKVADSKNWVYGLLDPENCFMYACLEKLADGKFLDIFVIANTKQEVIAKFDRAMENKKKNAKNIREKAEKKAANKSARKARKSSK